MPKKEKPEPKNWQYFRTHKSDVAGTIAHYAAAQEFCQSQRSYVAQNIAKYLLREDREPRLIPEMSAPNTGAFYSMVGNAARLSPSWDISPGFRSSTYCKLLEKRIERIPLEVILNVRPVSKKR